MRDPYGNIEANCIDVIRENDLLKKEIDEQRKVIEMAVEALKRQVPKKPTAESTRYGMVYDCSICNCGLIPHDGYCSRCGQAIDWSEE